jgi:hypothetical protein
MLQSRTLWLAGLTVMSLGPLGCVVEDTDDSAFVAQWRVAYVAGGGVVSCEDAGTPTVRLKARNLRSGAMYTANFPCDARSGITDVLPVGDYEVELALLDNFTNPDGTKVGRPVSQITGGPWAVRRHGLTDLDPIEFQVQVFEIDWILVRNAAGAAMRSVMCEEAGATMVELDTQLGNEAHEKFRWPCADGGGVTQAIRVGNYANQVRLLNAANGVLSETNVMSMKVGETERPSIEVQFDLR